MKRNENLLQALRRLRVETGSLACMGCGHEHDCGIRGCAIIREAADLIENQQREINMLVQANRTLVDGCEERRRAKEIVIGNYVVMQDEQSRTAEVSAAKRLLAQQAGAAVQRAMLENNLYIEKETTIGWKVKIYGKKEES